jgi:CBS domain-containing protein
MRVCELMVRELTSVDPADSIRTLAVSETPSIPVTDSDDRLVGVVSERDVLATAVPRYMELLHGASFMPNLDQLAAGLNRNADDPVKAHKSRKAISVRADADDLQAADLMLRHKVRLLPVVDADGRSVGVVRRPNLFKHVLQGHVKGRDIMARTCDACEIRPASVRVASTLNSRRRVPELCDICYSHARRHEGRL